MVLFAGIAVATPFQFAMHTVKPSHLSQSDDTISLLHHMAQSLNRGYPGRWERLMTSPITTGSHAIMSIHPSETRNVVQSWGLDHETLEETLRDIQLVVETAMSDGVFTAQGFVYNLPRCPINVPHPACLSNLMVVAQIQEVTDDEVIRFQLGHFYLTSTTETHQQPWNHHYCHRCRGWGHCCHDETRYRDLNMQEIEDVKAVLSTFQSEWALGQLASFFSRDTHVQLDDGQFEIGVFDYLLKQILENTDENRDAQRPHSDDLLRAIQNTTLSTRQASRVKQMSVPSTRIVMLLQMLLGNCFKRAGIQESVSEWWDRAYTSSDGAPISIECEFFDQQRESIDPMPECFIGSNVTSQTFYSWGLINNQGDAFSILFLDNDLTVAYIECTVTDEPSDGEFALDLRLSLNHPADESSGSIVRTATVHSDGSFHDVEFLAQWPRYSGYINKVALDLLRIAACAGFLKMPIPRNYWEKPAGVMTLDDPSFAALMSSIELFAKTWQEVVKAFGSSTSETVQRKVCLGFDSLSYKVDTVLLNGVQEDAVPDVVKILARRAILPDHEDLKLALELVVYSDDFTWLSQLMQYSMPSGEASFVFLGKYGNITDHRAKFVFSQVHSDFELAKDMLVVRQQSSKWGGLVKKDRTIIEYVPHTLTLNDTLVLQMFWQMLSYNQIATTLGVKPPTNPDLSFLCDRTVP